jgi:hypothetical protein
MPTVGGIVVPTGGAPASGRRTLLEIQTEIARPVDASDPTVLALAADAFRAAVRRMNRKGSWPWEYQEEDITATLNQRYSSVTGIIKKPMAMHYLTASGGVEDRHIHYQAYDVFSERFTMDVTGQPYVYTIPNLFETSQVRWWPTPSANYDLRLAYWRVTPVPTRETDTVEIPDVDQPGIQQGRPGVPRALRPRQRPGRPQSPHESHWRAQLMTAIPGARLDITGASGSQGLLAPRESWRTYVLPRGGYASQDSTGQTITFDSDDVASRFAANNWLQVGLDTSKIRQVDAVGGNSLTVKTTAVVVSKDDRIFLIGNTQPTVVGGSASYITPQTKIYQRDDDGSDLYANSMVTSDANGVVQFYAEPTIYDCLIQDGNQSAQGFVANLPVGVAEGVSTTTAAVFGATATFNAAVTMNDVLGVTGEATFGSTVTVNANLVADAFDFDGMASALTTVTAGSGTAASPWEDWQDALGESTTTFFPAGYYKVTRGATMYNGCGVMCAPGAIFLRDSGSLGVQVFNTGGVAISDFWIRGAIFDNNDLAVSDFDIQVSAESTDFRVERCVWKNLVNRAYTLTRVGANGTDYTSRFLWTRNDVQGTSNMTDAYNSFQFFAVSEFETSHNRIQGWGAIKHENLGAGNSRNWKVLYNKFYDIDQTCIFMRLSGGHIAHDVNAVGNCVEQQYEMTTAKGLISLGSLNGGSGGEWRGVYFAGNHAKGRLGHAFGMGDAEGGAATPVYNATIVGNIVDGRLTDDSTLESASRGFNFTGLNNSIITGNAISHVGRSGILLGSAATCSNVSVTGNYIEYANQTEGTSPTPSQEAGIAVWQTCSNIQISDNTVYCVGTSALGASYVIKGIYCDGGGTNRHIKITNNLIVDDRTPLAMEYGIQVGDGGAQTFPDVVVCTGNVIIGASDAPILDYVTGSTTEAIYDRNVTGGNMAGGELASGASVVMPAHGNLIEITGTANIATINKSWTGREVILRFTDAAPGDLITSGNLLLAGGVTFSPAQFDCITLVCDGVSWSETSPR